MGEIIADILQSVPHLLNMRSNHIWIDYDQDGDVLYVSFRKPQHADDSEMNENIITHYSGDQIVGITVIGAKKYAGEAL
jgi:uncharacterized protein YuzE